MTMVDIVSLMQHDPTSYFGASSVRQLICMHHHASPGETVPWAMIWESRSRVEDAFIQLKYCLPHKHQPLPLPCLALV